MPDTVTIPTGYLWVLGVFAWLGCVLVWYEVGYPLVDWFTRRMRQ